MNLQLFLVLARTAEWRVGNFNLQDLAAIARGFTKADQLDKQQLFVVSAREAERCLSNFITQELTNKAWAFTQAGQSDAQLFSETI